MDWLKGMNSVVGYIEDNLTQPIQYQSLSRIVGCSVYEFSRIFSFLAGMSISEYIRRRRLSQAAFDIQGGGEKIIDIALKYCYESPTTFARAFRELHGTSPSSARKASVSLKTYPPISFILTIKGANEMKHRIEKRGVMALEHKWLTCFSYIFDDAKSKELGIQICNVSHWVPRMLESARKDADRDPAMHVYTKKIAANDGYEDWEAWYADGLGNVALIDCAVSESGHTRVYMGRISEITDPQVIEARRTKNIAKNNVLTDPQEIEDTMIMSIEDIENGMPFPKLLTKIPPATWAVFSFDTEMTEQSLSEAYTRILTEWMPISAYKRDESMPHMEQYNPNGDNTWEIWLPVLAK